ncbi:MAG: hypothetical protein ACYDH5_10360 [Acidimicrobiales bacterium]
MATSSRRRLGHPGVGDTVVSEWRAAGLLRPSVVRAGRLLVLEARFLYVRLGQLGPEDLWRLDDGLRKVLGLEEAGS